MNRDREFLIIELNRRIPIELQDRHALAVVIRHLLEVDHSIIIGTVDLQTITVVLVGNYNHAAFGLRTIGFLIHLNGRITTVIVLTVDAIRRTAHVHKRLHRLSFDLPPNHRISGVQMVVIDPPVSPYGDLEVNRIAAVTIDLVVTLHLQIVIGTQLERKQYRCCNKEQKIR